MAMDIIERLRGYVAYNTNQSREEDDVMRDAASEIENLRSALGVLADAADVVGVKYFDTDTMDPEVEDMQTATSGARALLNPT